MKVSDFPRVIFSQASKSILREKLFPQKQRASANQIAANFSDSFSQPIKTRSSKKNLRACKLLLKRNLFKNREIMEVEHFKDLVNQHGLSDFDSIPPSKSQWRLKL